MWCGRLVAAAAIVWASSSALAQSGKEKLQQAAEAYKLADSLAFKVKAHQTGVMESMMPKTDTAVTMMREKNSGRWKMRWEGNAVIPPQKGGTQAETRTVLATTDGVTRKWIDDANKKVFERALGTERNETIQLVEFACPKDLGEEAPFAHDLESAMIDLKGTETVDGVLCDVVVVQQGQDRPIRTFVLGQADHLPRRIEWAMKGGIEFTQIHEFSGYTVNPEVPAERFDIPLPAGYKLDVYSAPSIELAQPPSAPPESLETPGGPKNRRPAPTFAIKDAAGADVSLDSLRGKITILQFGGTWSSAWKTSMPEFEKLAESYADQKMGVLGALCRQKEAQEAIDFGKQSCPKATLLPAAEDVARAFGVKLFPTVYVIGNEGDIIFEARGFKAQDTAAKIKEAVDAYLAEKAGGQ